MSKKREQLGMHPSTAAHRLRIDLLHAFATKLGYKCFHCGLELEREGFSVEHKVPWLDSASPLDSFFDLNNIAFSHLACNARAARREVVHATKLDGLRVRRKRLNKRRLAEPAELRAQRRREQYLRTGN